MIGVSTAVPVTVAWKLVASMTVVNRAGPSAGPIPVTVIVPVSPNTRWDYSIDRANQILDAGGFRRGPDGIRTRAGKRLAMLFQTSTNTPCQKTQATIKQSAARAGIAVELKAVVASVYFSSDAANPDTYNHFYADLQMTNAGRGRPDPQAFMTHFCSWEVAQKANKWAGRNKTRWRNEEYDRLRRAAEGKMDPVKRAALFIQMNDLVVRNAVVVPIVS